MVEPGFSFKDYYRMYKSRGLRLPVYYFFENHLFDLLNNTDTNVWLPKIHYSEKPKNFSNGVFLHEQLDISNKRLHKESIDDVKRKRKYSTN